MKRANGEGSIRRRPNGTFQARYTGSDGLARSITRSTRAEAVAALREALAAAEGGILPAAGRGLTVAAWLATWQAEHVAPRVRPRTAESYAGTARVHIIPAIGRIPLAKLTAEDVAAMLRGLEARRPAISSTTRRYAYTVLRIALGRAVKSGLSARNVATLVDPPARARFEPRPLTGSQVGALLAELRGTRLEALVTAAIGTGARQGELLALRWSDVDLDAGLLSIRHTLEQGTRRLAEPKTERSRRTLRLPADVLTVLREHRKAQLAERLVAGARWADLDLVFATRRGWPMRSSSVTHGLQAALERAGLPRQRFHDLRHAYATLMLEDGAELAVVSKSLGHSNLATTADVYAHLTPAMADGAAARMDGILSRSRAAG